MSRPRDGVAGLLSVRRCLAIAILGATAGVALRLVKPVEAPDPAFLERVESWKRLAPELEAAHRRERGK